MTSYGFNQNFNVGNFGSGGGGGFGGGFSYASSPPYQDGIKRDYYSTGYYNDDPYWFNYETPTDTTYPTDVISDPFNGSDPPNNFSIRWTGYFKAPTTETYTFYLTSDDASHMWIGPPAKVGWSIDNVFINNGGLHGGQEVSNTISLVAGNYYPIQVLFGEYGGGSILTFSYSTDTIPKTTDLTGLIYYSQNLDPFLRGIENKTPITLITSGSITINGSVFSWPTFDVTGPDPAGWNTLLTFAGPPLEKIYTISGAGSLGGPSQALLNFIGRGDLPAGTPLACSGSVSATGSFSVGDYGIWTESVLGTPGSPIHFFTDYLSGNVHVPGSIPIFAWEDTYGAEPPDPESSLVQTRIYPIDRNTGGNVPASMIVFVSPPPAAPDVVQGGLELWFDSRFPASYPGTGTSWTDMKNGIVATLGSGVTFDSVSGTMVFDGSGGAYASTPSYVANLSTGYTLEAYVRWDSLPSYDGVIAYNDPPRYVNMEYYSPGVRFEGAGAQIKDLVAPPTLGTFYHYVCVWDGAYIRLYKDGVEVASAAAAQVQSAAHTAQWIMGTWDGNLTGAITMTRLYSKALSPAEVLQNYNATLNPTIPPVAVPTPTLAWDPADFDGTNIPSADCTNTVQLLYLMGGPAVTYPPATAPRIRFLGDASTQRAYSAIAYGAPGPQVFTLSTWYRTGVGGRKIIGFEDAVDGVGGGSYDRHIYTGTDGKLYFGIYDGSLTVASSTGYVGNDNTWHHAVATFDANIGEMKLYVDGVLNDTVTGMASAASYMQYLRVASYKLGGWPNGADGYYDGAVGFIKFWDGTVLSAAETDAEYQNTRASFGV